MILNKENIKISSKGLIKLPEFIKVECGDYLFFRKDFYDKDKFFIIDSENLKLILNKSKLLSFKERRFVWSHIRDSKCMENRKIIFPFESSYNDFTCIEEINEISNIKKYILSPIKKI